MAHRPWQPCPTHTRTYCLDDACRAEEDHSPLNSTKAHAFGGGMNPLFPSADPIIPKLATTREAKEEFL